MHFEEYPKFSASQTPHFRVGGFRVMDFPPRNTELLVQLRDADVGAEF